MKNSSARRSFARKAGCMSGAVLAASTGFSAMAQQKAKAPELPPMPGKVIETVTFSTFVQAPRAYYEMCRRDRKLCERDLAGYPDGAPIVMSDKRWQQLYDTVRAVRKRHVPRTDFEMHNLSDVWGRLQPDGGGDCEDFAIEVRENLFELGADPVNIDMEWPAHSLLLTVVHRKNPDTGLLEGHALLSVRTDRGLLTVDVLSQDIKRLEDTGHTLLMIQSPANPYFWASLEGQKNLSMPAFGPATVTRYGMPGAKPH